MADIIRSREKDSNELINGFKEIVKTSNQNFGKNIESPLTITLGDEFQGIIKDITTAVEILILMEEEIIHNKLNFKLRYVINQGEIDTLINNKSAYEMMGQGLIKAREELGILKKKDFRFNILLDNGLLSKILNDAFIVFQSIIDSWKLKNDYSVVSNFLLYKDYKVVADVMKKNRSLMWKRKKSLNIDSYIAVKNIILTSLKLNNELP